MNRFSLHPRCLPPLLVWMFLAAAASSTATLSAAGVTARSAEVDSEASSAIQVRTGDPVWTVRGNQY